jgi:Tfp pilus assembly protein PilP
VRGRKYKYMDNNKINEIPDPRSKFGQFFKRNKTLVFALPILLVLIVVLIIVYSNLGTDKSTVADLPDNDITNNKAIDSTVSKNEDRPVDAKVEILPQKVRTEDQKNEGGNVTSQIDPFEQPMVLSGVLVNDNGDNIAIIESEGKSFVVKEGDTVGKNWKVEEIKEDGVILNNGEKDSFIQFEDEVVSD